MTELLTNFLMLMQSMGKRMGSARSRCVPRCLSGGAAPVSDLADAFALDGGSKDSIHSHCVGGLSPPFYCRICLLM